jgi:hypothetical protein
MEGIYGIRPIIKKLDFTHRGKIALYLKDGRTIISPLSFFPSIKKMPMDKRLKYSIVNDEMILFEYCNEIYHLQDFLGKEIDYRYKG